VLKRIMQAMQRFEPENKLTAEEIVAMIPVSWASMGESKNSK